MEIPSIQRANRLFSILITELIQKWGQLLLLSLCALKAEATMQCCSTALSGRVLWAHLVYAQ